MSDITHPADHAVPRKSMRQYMQRKSTIAFLMTLPLIVLIVLLVVFMDWISGVVRRRLITAGDGGT